MFLLVISTFWAFVLVGLIAAMLTFGEQIEDTRYSVWYLRDMFRNQERK